MAQATEAKSRPLLTARAKLVASRASVAAGYEFDWQSVLDVLVKLLPLLGACALFASDVRNPSRLTVRAVRNRCRHLCATADQAEILADAILSNADNVSDDDLAALKTEAK